MFDVAAGLGSGELGAGEVGDIVNEGHHGLHLCPLAGGLLVIGAAGRALAATSMIFSGRAAGRPVDEDSTATTEV